MAGDKPMKPRINLFLSLILAATCSVGSTFASTFRPIPLSQLVERSDLVVVATPVSAECHWAMIGTTQHLVTDFTLEVHWTLQGADTAGQDIVVRVRGGTSGNIGQITYGEARLAIGQSSLFFLMRGRDDVLHVQGMAQGHYPLTTDANGDWRLVTSPGLEGVLRPQLSATMALSGRKLSEVPNMLVTGEAVP